MVYAESRPRPAGAQSWSDRAASRISERLPQSVRWRGELLSAKLGGRCCHVAWRLLLSEVCRRHHPIHAELQCVAEDPDRGMVQVKAGDCSLWYPTSADLLPLEIIYDEVFNRHSGHFYEYGPCRIAPGSVVLDAGACEGYFVRYALDRGATVIAVEPVAQMAECLKRTFSVEITQGRLMVVQALLGSEIGEGRLSLDPRSPCHASTMDGYSGGEESAAPMTTIDEIASRLPGKRIDFIKMDIEGAEIDAVRGAKHVLSTLHPLLSITTYHRPTDYSVLRELVLDLAPDYLIRVKGIADPASEGIWRPLMMHGWSRESVRFRPPLSALSRRPAQ